MYIRLSERVRAVRVHQILMIKINWKLPFFALALCVISFAAASDVRAQSDDDDEAGGYIAIRTTDPRATAAAAFAVGERSKSTGAKVSVVSIRSAKSQVVAGVNYQLCMLVSVKEPNAEAYQELVVAVVYQNLQQKYSLSSWTEADECP